MSSLLSFISLFLSVSLFIQPFPLATARSRHQELCITWAARRLCYKLSTPSAGTLLPIMPPRVSGIQETSEVPEACFMRLTPKSVLNREKLYNSNFQSMQRIQSLQFVSMLQKNLVNLRLPVSNIVNKQVTERTKESRKETRKTHLVGMNSKVTETNYETRIPAYKKNTDTRGATYHCFYKPHHTQTSLGYSHQQSPRCDSLMTRTESRHVHTRSILATHVAIVCSLSTSHTLKSACLSCMPALVKHTPELCLSSSKSTFGLVVLLTQTYL